MFSKQLGERRTVRHNTAFGHAVDVEEMSIIAGPTDALKYAIFPQHADRFSRDHQAQINRAPIDSRMLAGIKNIFHEGRIPGNDDAVKHRAKLFDLSDRLLLIDTGGNDSDGKAVVRRPFCSVKKL